MRQRCLATHDSLYRSLRCFLSRSLSSSLLVLRPLVIAFRLATKPPCLCLYIFVGSFSLRGFFCRLLAPLRLAKTTEIRAKEGLCLSLLHSGLPSNLSPLRLGSSSDFLRLRSCLPTESHMNGAVRPYENSHHKYCQYRSQFIFLDKACAIPTQGEFLGRAAPCQDNGAALRPFVSLPSLPRSSSSGILLLHSGLPPSLPACACTYLRASFSLRGFFLPLANSPPRRAAILWYSL